MDIDQYEGGTSMQLVRWQPADQYIQEALSRAGYSCSADPANQRELQSNSKAGVFIFNKILLKHLSNHRTRITSLNPDQPITLTQSYVHTRQISDIAHSPSPRGLPVKLKPQSNAPSPPMPFTLQSPRSIKTPHPLMLSAGIHAERVLSSVKRKIIEADESDDMAMESAKKARLEEDADILKENTIIMDGQVDNGRRHCQEEDMAVEETREGVKRTILREVGAVIQISPETISPEIPLEKHETQSVGDPVTSGEVSPNHQVAQHYEEEAKESEVEVTIQEEAGENSQQQLAEAREHGEEASQCQISPAGPHLDADINLRLEELKHTGHDEGDIVSPGAENDPSFDEDLDALTSSQEPEPDPQLQPALTSSHTCHPSSSTTNESAMSSPSKIDLPPSKAQWRVGRLPGHQGSHVKPLLVIPKKRRVSSDEQPGDISKLDVVEDDIARTERVLKKPFRPPSKIKLPPAVPKRFGALPSSSSPSTLDTTAAEDNENADITNSSPLSKPSTSATSTTLASSSPISSPIKPHKASNAISSQQKSLLTPQTPRWTTIKPANTAAFQPFKTPGPAIRNVPKWSKPSQSPSSPLQPRSYQALSQKQAEEEVFETTSTPFNRSSAPSPRSPNSVSRPSRTSQPPLRKAINKPLTSISRKPMDPKKAANNKIRELQSEIRTLKQALKYANSPEEDTKLSELIKVWTTAGREVAEMLFQKYPKPDPSAVSTSTYSGVASGHGLGMGMGMGMGLGSWNGSVDDIELTREQKEYMKTLETNDRGEMVDGDGNVVIPLPRDDDLLASGGSDDIGGEYTRDYVVQSYNEPLGRNGSTSDISLSIAPTWSIGTMMLKLSVDPSLLGWNDEAEDWVDDNENEGIV